MLSPLSFRSLFLIDTLSSLFSFRASSSKTDLGFSLISCLSKYPIPSLHHVVQCKSKIYDNHCIQDCLASSFLYPDIVCRFRSMEERLFRNSAQQAYTDQQHACLQPSMFHGNDRMSVVHSTQPFSSMGWSSSYFPVYQSGMSIPFGLFVCAESVNPRVTSRMPSTSENLIRWTENYRYGASLQAAMKPPLPVAQRTPISLPAALKTPLPAALNMPRRFRPRYNQTPAFAQDGSVVLENVSFVEYGGSFHPQLTQHAVRSMVADVPVLDKSKYSGMYCDGVALRW